MNSGFRHPYLEPRLEALHRVLMESFKGLAEGVSAVIEAKSDIAAQWNEVLATANNVKKLRRRFRRQNIITLVNHLEGQLGTPSVPPQSLEIIHQLKKEAANLANEPDERIPVFAVGFNGWKTRDKLQEKLKDSPVDGILVLEPKLFESGSPYLRTSSGVWSLMTLLEELRLCRE